MAGEGRPPPGPSRRSNVIVKAGRRPDIVAVKLSKRGEYALRALIDLGIARELGRPILQVSELVEKERLPEKFIVQILIQLREAGYVESKRGKHGGYSLARPMEAISFGQVVRLIDGPLAPIACVSHTAYARCTCPDEAHCGLRMLMLDVRNAIADVLDRYTLADIVEVTLRKLKRDNADFHLDRSIPLPPELLAVGFGTGETGGSNPLVPETIEEVPGGTKIKRRPVRQANRKAA